MIEGFIRELKAFDWEFESSDDFQVYRTCRAKHKELDKRYRELSDDDQQKVVDALGWRDRLESKGCYINAAVTCRIMRSFSDK